MSPKSPEDKNKRFYEQLIITEQVTIKEDQSPLECEHIKDFEDRVLKTHIEESDKKLEPITLFSENERKKLEEIIETKAKPVGNGTYTVPFEEVAQAVEIILSEQKEQILPTFYRNINPSEEFGVSRFVADRMAYLPKLLEKITLSFIQDSTYLVAAELKDGSGNAVRLEHRFKASSDDEADKLYEKISSQLAGIQQKIWLACWSLANKLLHFTFTCQLTDLMKITYPERNSYFSVADKIEFYDHLKSLEQTKLGFSRPQKNKTKKQVFQTFEIPLLQIHSHVGGEEDKYPQQLTLSIMNPLPNPGKMAFVGASFKNRTLELHADDTQLATWIQTRKSQRHNEKFIHIELNFLIKLAGLERTAASNRRHAKKLLIKKLQRLYEKGIISSIPEKIEEMTCLAIR